MCSCHSKASISTDSLFTLGAMFSGEETKKRPLPPGLIPRLTICGPLLGSTPYLLVGIFSARSFPEFLFVVFFVMFCGFIVGVIPAFFGAAMFDSAMQRVSVPDLGSGLMAGFLCGALGATATLMILICLTAPTTGLEKDLPEIVGFCILQGGIPGAILGAIEGRKLERNTKADVQEVTSSE